MTTVEEQRQALRNFGDDFGYDVSYLEAIIEASPAAFQAFAPVQGMSSFRRALPPEPHFVARIATVMQEDCGACAQLNITMAQRAGIDREVLRALVRKPAELAPILQDVRAHAIAVVGDGPQDPDRFARLQAAYGKEGMAELAICIAATRIYPSLKRAMGTHTSCELLRVDL